MPHTVVLPIELYPPINILYKKKNGKFFHYNILYKIIQINTINILTEL